MQGVKAQGTLFGRGPFDARPPLTDDEQNRATTDMLAGLGTTAMVGALPFLPAAVAAAPVATALGIVTGVGGQKVGSVGARKIAEKLGVSQSGQDLAAEMGGMVGAVGVPSAAVPASRWLAGKAAPVPMNWLFKTPESMSARMVGEEAASQPVSAKLGTSVMQRGGAGAPLKIAAQFTQRLQQTEPVLQASARNALVTSPDMGGIGDVLWEIATKVSGKSMTGIDPSEAGRLATVFQRATGAISGQDMLAAKRLLDSARSGFSPDQATGTFAAQMKNAANAARASLHAVPEISALLKDQEIAIAAIDQMTAKMSTSTGRVPGGTSDATTSAAATVAGGPIAGVVAPLVRHAVIAPTVLSNTSQALFRYAGGTPLPVPSMLRRMIPPHMALPPGATPLGPGPNTSSVTSVPAQYGYRPISGLLSPPATRLGPSPDTSSVISVPAGYGQRYIRGLLPEGGTSSGPSINAGPVEGGPGSLNWFDERQAPVATRPPAAPITPVPVERPVGPPLEPTRTRPIQTPKPPEMPVESWTIDPALPVKKGGVVKVYSNDPHAPSAPLFNEEERIMLERMRADMDMFEPLRGRIDNDYESPTYGEYMRGHRGSTVGEDIRTVSQQGVSNRKILMAIDHLLEGKPPTSMLHTAALDVARGIIRKAPGYQQPQHPGPRALEQWDADNPLPAEASQPVTREETGPGFSEVDKFLEEYGDNTLRPREPGSEGKASIGAILAAGAGSGTLASLAAWQRWRANEKSTRSTAPGRKAK